jgi:hypothetical protein
LLLFAGFECGANIARAHSRREFHLVQFAVPGSFSLQLLTLQEELVVLFFWHLRNRRVQRAVLGFALFPNIERFALDTLVADEGSASNVAEGLNAVGAAVFYEIRPYSVRA